MFNKSLASLGGALALTALVAVPAYAQDGTGTGNGPASGVPTISAPTARVTPSRMGGQRENREQTRRQQAAAPADPAVIQAQAEAALAAASTTCQITEAKLLGQSPEKANIYETSCAGAPGYIVVASTPPQAVDCVILSSQAASAHAANPEAPASPTCSLPGNQDIMGFLKAYATQAGVACTVDDAKVRGQSGNGGVIYEIGCTGVDGYWIEKTATGWEKTECLQVVSQSGTCQLTTPAEQAATAKSWLAGSAAADCNVGQVRLMGENANGRFYEMTCAGADGVIGRFNAQHAVQQIYKCAEAASIGGGCKLGGVAADAPKT